METLLKPLKVCLENLYWLARHVLEQVVLSR